MKSIICQCFPLRLSRVYLNFYVWLERGRGQSSFVFGLKNKKKLLFLTVSVGQELGHGLSGQFWLRVSYEESDIV